MSKFKKTLLVLVGLAVFGAAAAGAAFLYLKSEWKACAEGQGDKAITSCNTIIRAASLSDQYFVAMFRSTALTCKAKLLGKQGKYQEAYDNGLLVLDISRKLGNPEMIAMSYFMLGTISSKRMLDEETIKDYALALEAGKMSNTLTALSHSQMGHAYANLGRYTEAIASLEKAVLLGTPKAAVVYDLGVAYLRTNDYLRASVLLMEAETGSGKYLRLNEYLGEVNLRLGRYEASVPYFNSALKQDPACAPCSAGLAQAQEMLRKQTARPQKRGRKK